MNKTSESFNIGQRHISLLLDYYYHKSNCQRHGLMTKYLWTYQRKNLNDIYPQFCMTLKFVPKQLISKVFLCNTDSKKKFMGCGATQKALIKAVTDIPDIIPEWLS